VSTPSRYRVVVNDEEQYSIWPDGQALPPGWTDEGTTGTKEECLSHVDEIWKDMRPKSLRSLSNTLSRSGSRGAPRTDDEVS